MVLEWDARYASMGVIVRCAQTHDVEQKVPFFAQIGGSASIGWSSIWTTLHQVLPKSQVSWSKLIVSPIMSTISALIKGEAFLPETYWLLFLLCQIKIWTETLEVL